MGIHLHFSSLINHHYIPITSLPLTFPQWLYSGIGCSDNKDGIFSTGYYYHYAIIQYALKSHNDILCKLHGHLHLHMMATNSYIHVYMRASTTHIYCSCTLLAVCRCTCALSIVLQGYLLCNYIPTYVLYSGFQLICLSVSISPSVHVAKFIGFVVRLD